MRKVTLEGFVQFNALGNLQWNGEDIISFQVTKPDLQNDRYDTSLWLLSCSRGESIRLQVLREGDVCHWKDSDSLWILSHEDVETRRSVISEIHVSDRTRREVFVSGMYVCDFRPVADRGILLYCWEKPNETDCVVLEEVPFWREGTGFCSGSRSSLWLAEPERIVRLSTEDVDVEGYCVVSDRNVIFFGTENRPFRSTSGKLFKADLADLHIELLDGSEMYIYAAAEDAGKERILLARNDRALHGEYQDEYIDLLSLDDGSFQRMNGNCQYHLRDSIVSDVTYRYDMGMRFLFKEEELFFLATVGESSHIMRSGFQEGKAELVTREEREKVSDFTLAGDELFFVAMTGTEGAELYRVKKDGSGRRKMTHFNERNIYLTAQPKPMTCIGTDGYTVNGFVLEPVDLQPKRKFPAVLFIHGGPNLAYGSCYVHEMQFLAAEGFGIVFCNPRGSVGRGGDFADIRQRYGTVDFQDILAFMDQAAKCFPWIDTERLAVTGGSYGGIMTNWIVGHSRRFKTAIADRSLSNNISDFGTSDIGFSCGIDTNGTTPWDSPAFLWETSPLKYADRITTPMLFIHGEDDYRCPVDHALQMHSALTYFGTPSRVVIFKGENHSLWKRGRPKVRARRLEEMIGWLKRYLGETSM